VTDAETIEELRRENAELRRRLEEALRIIEEWKRGHRERAKRRTSRTESARARTGRGPGRSKGHEGSNRPVPDRIDREVVHPLPAACSCGGEVDATGETQSTIVQDLPKVEVENVRHVACVGKCRECGARVSAHLPGASALGDAATQVQVGPGVLALGLSLRFEHHVPLRGISSIFSTWFGVAISPGGLAHLFARHAQRTAAAYAAIETSIRTSDVVGADETGLRENGVSGYTWILRTDRASLFRVERSRGAWVIDDMLGDGFQGVVCSDFYGAYTRRGDLPHGYCGAHMIREAKKIAEVSPSRLTARFSVNLRTLYRRGVAAQHSGDRVARDDIRYRFSKLANYDAFARHPDLSRLQARMREHHEGIVLFIDRPDVPFTNNATERDLRPIAVHRKITGGTRSPRGSDTLEHWMSVTQTLRKNDIGLREWVFAATAAHAAALPIPPPLQTQAHAPN
jgi:transposase